MLRLRKRGETYHVDFFRGHDHEIRRTLGTRNEKAAASLIAHLEIAMAQGASSTIWSELNAVLPRDTYLQFAKHIGVTQIVSATWTELREKFEEDLENRIAIHDLAESSETGFRRVLRDFDVFLNTKHVEITLLRDINHSVIREYKYYRVEQIQEKRGPQGGAGFRTELSLLHRVFEFGVEEQMIAENPVELEADSRDENRGAQPFEPEELLLMRENFADEEDRLSFLVFRWTGLRVSDAASLLWQETNLEKREIRKLTKKSRYKKLAIIPMQEELASALETERALRKPKPCNPILHLRKGKLRESRLYYVMRTLGERAGVDYVYPQRFRDTFAVDALVHKIPDTSVARMLADTVEVVRQYYLPFVTALREQTRDLLDTGEKLEDLAGAHWRHNREKAAS